MAKVSIRIMTFNSERFIARSLDSCFAQTFQDFEVCVADDASTDGTVDIIRKYQAQHPGKIKLHVQPTNMGQYSLLINGNAGRDMCTGEYVAILDGDEYMLPDRLEKQVRFLDSNPNYIAVSHNKMHLDYITDQEIELPHQTHKKDELSTKELILNGNQFQNCYMMRNHPLRANLSLRVMGDWDYIIRLSMLGKLGFQQNKLTAKYWHDENVTKARVDQIRNDAFVTLALLEKEYPELLPYIEARRTSLYMAMIRSGDRRFLRVLLGRPVSTARALLNKFSSRLI